MRTLLFCLVSLAFVSQLAAAELTVLTDRPKDRLQKAAQVFSAQTGHKVNFVEASFKDLLKNIEQGSAGDLVIAKDLVYFNQMNGQNRLQPMQKTSGVLVTAEAMRDPSLNWVALSYRARTVAYHPQRVKTEELTTYQDLASEQWQGRLCLRSSQSAYNEALVSFFIESYGVPATQALLAGWMRNLATPVVPQDPKISVLPNDTQVLEAIANGICDVGIVNHYYLGQILARDPNFPVRVSFLDQSLNGTHTNGAAAGILRQSQQPALAQKFIEILLTDEIQLEFSAAHFDYPAAKHLQPTSLIKDWGVFKASPVSWSALGQWHEQARKLMNEAGYR